MLSLDERQKRYKVIDTVTGEEQSSVFVLFPVESQPDRTALIAYADAVRKRDPHLASQLFGWLASMLDWDWRIDKVLKDE